MPSMLAVNKKKILFCYLMQIQQIFIILRQPVTILATVFSNPTKLTNDLFYFVSFRHLDLQLVILDLAKLQDQL